MSDVRPNPIPQKYRDVLYLIGGVVGLVGGPSTGTLLTLLGYEDAAVPTLIVISILGGLLSFLAKANVGEKGVDAPTAPALDADEQEEPMTIEEYEARYAGLREQARVVRDTDQVG